MLKNRHHSVALTKLVFKHYKCEWIENFYHYYILHFPWGLDRKFELFKSIAPLKAVHESDKGLSFAERNEQNEDVHGSDWECNPTIFKQFLTKAKTFVH